MNDTHVAYIGVGSNMGDRLYYIREAEKRLNRNGKITILSVSPLYETEPYGGIEQAPFINCVFELETTLVPEDLLTVLNAVEKVLDRERIVRWGPRTIDLDILFFDDIILKTDALTIPHREIHKRLFVLAPLCDIVPDKIHPEFNKSCKNLKNDILDENILEVKKISVADPNFS